MKAENISFAENIAECEYSALKGEDTYLCTAKHAEQR